MLANKTRLRVAIDARYWRSSIQTGVERYIFLLLEALQFSGSSVDVCVIVTSKERTAFPIASFGNVQLFSVPTKRTSVLNKVLNDFAPSVVHYPFDLPEEFDRPSVYTLHDPGRYLYPDLMVRKIRDVHNDRLKRQLRNPLLRAVVTVSKASRSDIISVLGELQCPLTVVPNFVSADFAEKLRRSRLVERRPPNKPFLLAVGIYIPTKNIPRLVRAFRLARARAPDVVPPNLTLVGRLGWERGFPIGGAADLTVLGHVDDDRLAQLYATCTAFVFPSFYEGFGIPVLEALMAGARVLCADIPVFHEVGAALVQYADPHDDEQLAEGIVARCLKPAPVQYEVDQHLLSFTAPNAGRALLKIYNPPAR